MGCGKSTVGKLIAKSQGMTFVDTDQLIAKNEGSNIQDIFSNKGEEYFRNLESKTIKSLLHQHNTVISVGGGLPCHHDNMSLLNDIGHTFYIKVGVKILATRLKKDKNRPLLNALSTDKELKIYINKKLKERSQYYHKSEYTVMGSRLPVHVANRIVLLSELGINHII